MKIGNKEFNDECSKCGKVLECDLCLSGHGIYRERDRVTEMVRCQLEHQSKRDRENEES